MIKSISYDEQEIIRNILTLHCNGESIELDPTYSKGNFYKKGLTQPKYKFDIDPKTPGVLKADCRNLPIENQTIKVIMFDPPFLATKGKSLEAKNGSNIIAKRFGVYPDERSLHEMYKDSLKEFYRILMTNGTLIFKCQDKVSSQKQYFSHCYIYEQAREMGYYAKDLFMLLAKNRVIADWQLKNQQHGRKFHSYFWVFQKINKNVYI